MHLRPVLPVRVVHGAVGGPGVEQPVEVVPVDGVGVPRGERVASVAEAVLRTPPAVRQAEDEVGEGQEPEEEG